mgnify:CR=1 FL=1
MKKKSEEYLSTDANLVLDTIVSFYKFVDIEDPFALQKKLKCLTSTLGIKGTILLASEGINAMISGTAAAISEFKDEFKKDLRFADIEFKDSYYDDTSFRRMLVKVKKYIITMRQDVNPAEETGEYLDPLEFKKWQDEKRDILILDTRNDYEVSVGTFSGAINPNIKSFDEFPAWIDNNLKEDKEKPIVTFCTGGIRCEKATAYMQRQGFKKVYQLRGGIIKYFEETLKAETLDSHWEGDCVVFDKRKAISKDLKPSKKDICYLCLTELHPDNKAEKPLPAGDLCIPCFDKMNFYREKRRKQGMIKHKENLKKRAEFLRSEAARYKKSQLEN